MNPIPTSLRDFNPFATKDGKPTSQKPITVGIGGHQAEIDLTPLGNQTIRKVHDSAKGVPNKIGILVDLLADPSPTIEESSHHTNEILQKALTLDPSSQSSSSTSSFSQNRKIVSAKPSAPRSSAPRPSASKATEKKQKPTGPVKEDISSKIRTFKPFEENTVDSDDED